MANKNSALPESGEELTWETVDEGSRIKVQFEEIGEVFIGIYEGHETITDPTPNSKTGEHDSWEQYNFRGYFPAEIKDLPCCIAAGWSLQNGLSKAEVGQLVRITFTRTTDTGQQSPMKEFRVDIRR